jgi:hypothetical protein
MDRRRGGMSMRRGGHTTLQLYAKPDVSVPCVIISVPSLLCIPVLISLLLSLPFTEISNYILE